MNSQVTPSFLYRSFPLPTPRTGTDQAEFVDNQPKLVNRTER